MQKWNPGSEAAKPAGKNNTSQRSGSIPHLKGKSQVRVISGFCYDLQTHADRLMRLTESALQQIMRQIAHSLGNKTFTFLLLLTAKPI